MYFVSSGCLGCASQWKPLNPRLLGPSSLGRVQGQPAFTCKINASGPDGCEEQGTAQGTRGWGYLRRQDISKMAFKWVSGHR